MLIGIPKRLEQIRVSKGWEKREFAKKMGFKSPASYSRLLSQENGLSTNAMSAMLHDPELSLVNFDWLFTGRGAMYHLDDKKNIVGDNNQIAIGNSSNSSNYNTTNEELIVLRGENKSLQEQLRGYQEQLKLKDEIIQLLKEK